LDAIVCLTILTSLFNMDNKIYVAPKEPRHIIVANRRDENDNEKMCNTESQDPFVTILFAVTF
jgi:hypothetical protein